MKSKIFSIFASAAVLIGAASCDNLDTRLETEGEGRLNTSSIDVKVNNAEEIIKGYTGTEKKSLSRSVTDLSSYKITVFNKKTGKAYKQWTYATMPELPTFPVGDYTIKVASGEVPSQAEFDAPFFSGGSDFTIVADQITDVEPITCVLSNIKVTVKFTDELVTASAGDLKVVLTSEGTNMLDFTPDEKRAGYFPAIEGLTTLSFTFSGTVNSKEERFGKVLENVAAGQHRIITFGLKTNPNDPPVAVGGIGKGEGFSVSTNVEEENLTVPIDYEEDPLPGNDRPGQEGEDPNKGDDPNPPTPPVGDKLITFTSETLDLEGVNEASEYGEGVKPAVVVINSENGFQSLYVKIISNSLDKEMLQGVGLDNEFDLAAPGSYKDALSEDFGFPVDTEVTGDGITEVTFDITKFVPLLLIYSGEEHQFEITVTDKTGNKESMTLKFNA